MDQPSIRGQPMVSTARHGLFVNNRNNDLELGGQEDDRRVPFRWGLTSLLPVRPAAVGRADTLPVHISQPTSSNLGHALRTNCQDPEIHSGIRSTANAVCSDPTHDRACLLVRRTEMRQKKAWMRHRSGPLSRLSRPRPSLRARSAVCFVCTILLIATVSTYVGLLSTSSQSTPVHITFILLLIFASVSFLYTFFRLCFTFASPRGDTDGPCASTSDPRVPRSDRRRNHHHRHVRHRRRHKRPNLNHPDLPRGDDALPFDDSLYTPSTPVRVFLSSDESFLHGKQVANTPELFTIDNSNDYNSSNRANAATFEPINAPPPAYGLWRCSVRADPNLLHWLPSPTRVDTEDAERSAQAGDIALGGEQATTSYRPPSYVSADEREQESTRSVNNVGSVSIGGGGVEEEAWPTRSVTSAVQEATRMLISGRY